MKDVVTVWCLVCGLLCAIFFGVCVVRTIIDWVEMNRYALLAWVIFFGVTFGGLGFFCWGWMGAVLCGVVGAIGSYYMTQNPTEWSETDGE